MPVPNSRILNPFVPRDDLGIEEDISNKLYLPSDVSLSLATMVGRNGRKPRIVQMDDDGSTYVTFGQAIGNPSSLKSTRLIDNQVVHDTDVLLTFDISSYELAYIVFLPISSSVGGSLAGISLRPYLHDGSHSIGYVGSTINIGTINVIALLPLWYTVIPFYKYDLVAIVPDAPATCTINVDLYHS